MNKRSFFIKRRFVTMLGQALFLLGSSATWAFAQVVAAPTAYLG